MMKAKWLISMFAAAPMIAAILAVQSCGGVGGPTGGGTVAAAISQQFLELLGDSQRTATPIGSEACADCHGGRADGDSSTYAHWQETTHATNGVGCESCHGNGSAHRAAPSKENILTFPKVAATAVCGQCHGQIADQHSFSAHAQIVASPVNSAKTNPAGAKTSRCMACHSGIFRAEITEQGVDFATMPNEQIAQIAENTLSVVSQSAACATCHDPHQRTGNLSDDGKEVQLRRKTFNSDTTNVAPGVNAATFTNFDHGCATCHNGRGTNPADTSLNTATARPSMHDSNQYQMLLGFGGVEDTNDGPVLRNTAHATMPGQCSKCHMPESRHSFTVSFDKGCQPCHTTADAAARTATIKDEVLTSLVALRTRMENWMVNNPNPALRDPDFWDYTSLILAEGKTPPAQNLIPIELKRARHNYYFVLRSGDYGVHNAPYAKYLLFIANQNLNRLPSPPPPSSGGRVVGSAAAMTFDQKLRITESDRRRAREADLAAGDDH